MRGRAWGRPGALAVVAAVSFVAACAGPSADPAPRELLRIGTSGDYAPFSWWNPASHRLEGFDIDLARAYAADRGRIPVFIRFDWPDLRSALLDERFPIALSGITVRRDRSIAGRFSVPTTVGGAVPLVLDPARFRVAADLDHPEVRIAVNRGGHLERVARAHFPRAQILPRDANGDVPAELAAGRADAVLTDSFEAPHWLAQLPGAVSLPRFTRDHKAAWLHPARPELAADFDAWLLAREADGQLAEWRRRHLGETSPARTARPLPALLASMEERLALMPLVAEVKRRRQQAVRDARREERVVEAAVAATHRAARELDADAPADAAVRAFFRAQIAAARAVQEATLAGPPLEGPMPSLDDELRPALLRIGTRIASLLVRLPADLDPDAVRESTERALADLTGLDFETRAALALALVDLARAPRASVDRTEAP